MQAFIPLIKMLLEVLFPFILDEIKKPNTAIIIDETDAEALRKIKEMPRAFSR